MLAACEEALVNEKLVVNRLIQILTRLRTHANLRHASGRGHRLPSKGFETLALLCNAVLRACAAHEEFLTPYALLQLTGAYYQRQLLDGTNPGSGREQKHTDEDDMNSIEFLSTRIFDHPLFTDLRL